MQNLRVVVSESPLKFFQEGMVQALKGFLVELMFSLVKRIQVSSACNLKSQSFTVDFISFTYNEKSMGPKMDPWGSPQFKGPGYERLL